jgi:hypothetical protein
VARCDIDDPKAVISINSDASAFQFRQQSADDSGKFRSKEKKEGEGHEQSGASKDAVLDVDALEHLKEGLGQEADDLGVLYDPEKQSMPIGVGSDDEDEEPRIVVLRLRKYLEKVSAALKGDGDPYSESSGDDGPAQESSSSEDSDEERRRRRAAQKRDDDAAFERQIAHDENEIDEAADQALNEIDGGVLGDVYEKGDEVVARLARQADDIDEDERRRLLDQVADGYDDIERLLAADKARQGDLLKERLEARRRRKKKLQDNLDNVENRIAGKQHELQEQKEAVEARHNKEYQNEMKAIEKEKQLDEEQIDKRWDDEKAEKLADYMEKLRDA